ncbi:MAG TPA: GNAT family N-acetyltransferase [Acidimicrobiales bacterium]|nr:GNAT family N-acetyltransferase [Acidimicrobiales bacterium]
MSNGPGLALLETDRRYFEIAAVREEMAGATVAWMPGLAHLAAACVVHRTDAGRLPAPERWFPLLDDTLRRLGASWVRVYLEGQAGPLEAALEANGCRPRAETGYLGSLARLPAEDVALLPVCDEQGWEEKLRLHQRAGTSSSLYRAGASEWVELERRKCESGAMRAFLVTVDGTVCGTVCAISAGALLRVKNLLIESHVRGRGLAGAVLAQLSRLAEREGAAAVGAFAVEGSAGERLYRRAGFRAVARQVEWSRAL